MNDFRVLLSIDHCYNLYFCFICILVFQCFCWNVSSCDHRDKPFLSFYVHTATMRPLEHLPVWVVIRLCTDEDKMVDYWNGIDNEIELNMDVIDDPLGEAEEIHRWV